MRLFEAKDLTKKYDKTVLNHLDFSIDEGEVVGIIGVSGCGKSTLARLVSGIENLLQVLYYIKEKQLILKRVVKIYNLFFKIQLKAFRHE